MMGNTAFRHVPVGIVFQLRRAPSHISRHVPAFIHTEFHDRWIGRGGGSFPGPPFVELNP
jgi:hypothetical protein